MKEIHNPSQYRGWSCHYRDGKVIDNLTHEESFDLFQLAFDTDNPCNVKPPYIEYKSP